MIRKYDAIGLFRQAKPGTEIHDNKQKCKCVNRIMYLMHEKRPNMVIVDIIYN